MSAPRIGAVVQARAASTRLPGKVIMPLSGKPVLAWLLERLTHGSTLDTVVVATSQDPSDDPVAELCTALEVPHHRGPHDDVAVRLVEAAEAHSLDALVRVNGDSPLLDQRLVDHGARLFSRGGCDLVTNVWPRSFPRGQSVEVIRTTSLRSALAWMTEPGDREHVTSALYRDPRGLVIENFDAGPDGVGADGGAIRLVLDTPEDAARIRRIFGAMDRPHWEYGWQELLELARAQESLA